MSSPALPMIATGAPSRTVSPSFTRSFNRTPSSSMLKSMFALSVSTSATRSPGDTLSPSFLVQRTRTPSSIVGDSFGKPMICAICLLQPFLLEIESALHRGDDVVDLRLHLVLEVLGVRHRHVIAGDALDRRVEKVHAQPLHLIRDLGAEPGDRPADLDDHCAAGLLDRLRDGVDVERTQRADVDDLGLDALLR